MPVDRSGRSRLSGRSGLLRFSDQETVASNPGPLCPLAHHGDAPIRRFAPAPSSS
jgi:hypothetical protein